MRCFRPVVCGSLLIGRKLGRGCCRELLFQAGQGSRHNLSRRQWARSRFGFLKGGGLSVGILLLDVCILIRWLCLRNLQRSAKKGLPTLVAMVAICENQTARRADTQWIMLGLLCCHELWRSLLVGGPGRKNWTGLLRWHLGSKNWTVLLVGGRKNWTGLL